MSLPSVLTAHLDDLARDSTSGATPLAQHAASIVLQAIDPRLEIADADLPGLLTDLTYSIIQAQPTIAPVLNLGNKILRAVHHPAGETELRTRIRSLAGAIMNQLETSIARIALHAQPLFEKATAILTISNSSAVRKSLLQAQDAGMSLSVFCAESRPMREGVDLAKELARHGIRTTLIADAAMTSVLPEADLVRVGADSLSLRGLVNKVGTSGLAVSAADKNVPLYALCGSEKFIPAAFVVIEKKPAQELLPEAPVDVAVRNVYFDITPLEQLAGVISEEGIRPIAEVRTMLSELETSFVIRPDRPGLPFTPQS